MMQARISSAIVLGAAVAALAQQPPPRDGVRPNALGTASIRGVVLSTDPDPKPIRRAHMSLQSVTIPDGYTAITEDDGSFIFERLPAGEFRLAAAKDAYVTTRYGAKGIGRPGRPIVLQAGESRAGVTIHLPRGSVITGLITGRDAQPVEDAVVQALTYRHLDGRRELSAVAAGGGTDDRGVYRLFGLPPGDYIVSVRVPRPAFPAAEQLSAAEIRRALAEVAETRTQSTPGMPPPLPRRTSRPSAPERAVAYAPVYFPGTSSLTQARTISVGVAEERAGIDFQIEQVALASVEGFISASLPSVRSTVVALVPADGSGNLGMGPMRRTGVSAEGRFRFGGVPPGHYTVTAFRRILRAPGSEAPRTPEPVWGSADVIVAGDDVAGVTVTLQPGISIAGRVVFEGRDRPPVDLSAIPLPLHAIRTGSSTHITLPDVRLTEDGAFEVEGIVPGRYSIPMQRGFRTPVGGWWLKSIRLNGRELLDGPMDLRQSADDAVVTFTDRTTELSGIIRSPGGEAAPEHTAIVFGTDPASWFPGSRRIAMVRPSATGRYAVRNLPPGEYFVAAEDDVAAADLRDPAFLHRLAAEATRVTVEEEGVISVDLVAGGRL